MRILLVEDSRDLSTWLAKVLRNDGYAVDLAYDGEEADDLLQLAAYDLVILDLALPRLDGLDVLRRLRARGGTVPVILLTANASLNGRVRGLDEGADDYLVKPFEVAELEARIRAQLRRADGRPTPLQSCGDLILETSSRTFTLAGLPLALTPREHAVLAALMRRPGRTQSKTVLAEAVFGFDDNADPSAIEIYVHRLRKKLDGSTVTIATLRGVGYLLRDDAS
ncbi:response regulator [Lichenihabitans psoromatis]|uniref:response regulator n=1 Tax=Lichenihabitans psoromatis TaxID=2528642 RepID=UPI0010355AC5|nr:response regulator [Lichenihabitans psoromatis]